MAITNLDYDDLEPDPTPHLRQAPAIPVGISRDIEAQLETRAEVVWMATTVGDLPDLADLIHRPAWHEQAACRGVGTEAFFIERGGDNRPAKALCAICEVQAPCLTQGLAGHEKGTWGGTSEKQRRQARSLDGGLENAFAPVPRR